MSEVKLTDEQQALLSKIKSSLRIETALAYIRGGYNNRTRAYLDACETIGKKPAKVPFSSASEILNFPDVKAFIDSVKLKAAETVNIDAAWVLKSAKKVYDRCMQEEQVTDREGAATGEYKFEHSGANKALEIIGKHVDVKAFDNEQKGPSDSLADSVNKLIDKLPN